LSSIGVENVAKAYQPGSEAACRQAWGEKRCTSA
jgi:hypothetical protein